MLVRIMSILQIKMQKINNKNSKFNFDILNCFSVSYLSNHKKMKGVKEAFVRRPPG